MDEYLKLKESGNLGIDRDWEEISGIKTVRISDKKLEEMGRDLLKKDAIDRKVTVKFSDDKKEAGPLYINVKPEERKWRTPEDHLNKAVDYIIDRNTWKFKEGVTLGELTAAEDQLRRAQMRSGHEAYKDYIENIRREINKKKMYLS